MPHVESQRGVTLIYQGGEAKLKLNIPFLMVFFFLLTAGEYCREYFFFQIATTREKMIFWLCECLVSFKRLLLQ